MSKVVYKTANKKSDRESLPTGLPKGGWSKQALRILKERYLNKNDQGEVIETADEMVWRVALAVAKAERVWGTDESKVLKQAKKFYKLMIEGKFLPNSPTLMNAGKDNGLQYSACFVLPVEDSLEGIFDAIKYQAIIHQSGGGTGFSFSDLRQRGAIVKRSRGVASGPVSFMRVFNEATQQIKQGGTRRGANMGILRVDHPDIREFITSKIDGGITNFNISVAVTDEFMKAVEEGREYDLIAPHTREVVGTEKAEEIFELIAETAWKTGDPGIIFVDKINNGTANPVPSKGPVQSTNPCVTGDTLISTKDGLKRIEDLMGKDVDVLVDGRLGKNTYERVIKAVKTGKKEVFCLLTKEGYELRLTADHRVMTNEGWVEAGKLRFGDKIYLSNREGGFGSDGSSDLGRVMGWLVGDGTFSGEKTVLSFFGEEKEKLAGDFALMVDELVADTQKLNREYGMKVINIAGRDEARVASVRLTRLMSGYGLSKGLKLKVPEIVFTGSEKMQAGFLQALFTADGHVSGGVEKGVSVRLTSVSLSLLKDVQRLLLNFGVASKIYQNRRKEKKRMLPNGKGGMSVYHCRAYHDLVISKASLLRFAERVGFLLESKNSKLAKLLKKYKRGPYKEVCLATFDKLVVSGVEQVYDLTEPVTHSFVANGLVVHNCGEQPLYPFDACNLGSIFLDKFVVREKDKKPEINWKSLRKTIKEAVRFLDDVIEVNPYPLKQIEDVVRSIRRIGLGVGGWGDMLYLLEIPYNSEEALRLAKKVMKMIKVEGHKASRNLAKTRGPFELWRESIFAKGEPQPKADTAMRNATVTTIAPTGSIGIIANTSGGCEPVFALSYKHMVKDESLNREMFFTDPAFEKVARDEGFWSKSLAKKVAETGSVEGLSEIPEKWQKILVTSHQISPDWHVKMQAAWQEHTDNAVSKTVNLPNNASVKDVAGVYRQSFELGCMGVTVYRDGSKDWQVLNVGKSGSSQSEVKDGKSEIGDGEGEMVELQPRPERLTGSTYKIKTPVGTAFVVINSDDLGNPFEVFINVGKAGTHVMADAEAIGRLLSMALRIPSVLPAKAVAEAVIEQLAGIGGMESVGFGNGKVRSLADGVAKVLKRYLEEKESKLLNGHSDRKDLKVEKETMAVKQEQLILSSKKADLCPDCGQASLVLEEGCAKCYSCGVSKC